jgi:hypothetical protein
MRAFCCGGAQMQIADSVKLHHFILARPSVVLISSFLLGDKEFSFPAGYVGVFKKILRPNIRMPIAQVPQSTEPSRGNRRRSAGETREPLKRASTAGFDGVCGPTDSAKNPRIQAAVVN